MNYSFLQKITSSILIFAFFFGITFRIPLYNGIFNINKANAEQGNQRYNIVSIFVEKNLYPKIKNRLDRYAKDISGVLEKTRVVIIPVKKDVKPFVIASLNEKFYYDGYKKNSKLIGTILVGELPIPFVYDGSSSARTIFPYVDFEDKAYIYDHKTKKYKRNSKNRNGLKAEIWHSVIRPNEEGKTITQAINDFFDKDHDFYVGKGLFKKDIGVINGNPGEEVSREHKPYIFYYDGIRENKAIVYKNYLAYLNKLKYLEDLSYNRYTKELADKIKDLYLDSDYSKKQKNIIKKLLDVNINKGVGSIETQKIPDIHTRRIIQKTTKTFIEIFNKGVFGEIEKFVHNAGRYNKTVKINRAGKQIDQARVNVDTVAEIVTKLDEISRKTIKTANTDLENYIDDLVRNKGLSRYLPLLQRIFKSKRYDPILRTVFLNEIPCIGWHKEDRYYYKNILYGKLAKSIGEKDYKASNVFGKDIIDKENGAKMCSIYRGSLTLEQYNNINSWNDYLNYSVKVKNSYNTLRGGFRFGKIVEANRARAVNSLDDDDLKKLRKDLEYVFEGPDITSLDDLIKPDGKKIFSLSQLDINILKNESTKKCLKPLKKDDKPSLKGWFGMSSNLAINTEKIRSQILELVGVDVNGEKLHANLKGSIIPLFNINGAKNLFHIYAKPDGFYKLTGENLKKKLTELLPSASQCLKPNLILKKYQKYCEYIPYKKQDPFLEYQKTGNLQSKRCKDIFRLPIEGQKAKKWGCTTQNLPIEFNETFSSIYKKIKDKKFFKDGERKILYLGMGDKLFKTTNGYIGGAIVSKDDEEVANEYQEGGICDNSKHPQFLTQYFYKKIYSDVKHKSPTEKEYYEQLKGKVAYSLPVDKDRYVDFISAIGKDIKIYYPYLFRITGNSPSLEEVKKTLDAYLDMKSERINETIRANNPEILEGYDREIYELLKIADYPEANIDLKAWLKNKPSKEFEIAGEKKIVSYYDLLAFSIFWKNMKSPSSKYKYVMKYYLSDQFGGNKFNFPLLGNKKMYEIAYLGEHGDARNMFVRIDPKLKRENPFGELEQKNIEFKNKLYAQNSGASEEIIEDRSKKCAPPEGVSLLKWPQALECWIKDMLPPKVRVSRGTCGESWDKGVCKLEDFTKKLLGSSHVEPSGVCSKASIEEVNKKIRECDGDENKNGINDCIDKYLKEIELVSNNKKYSFNSSGKLTAKLKTRGLDPFLDGFDKVLVFDNTVEVYFKLVKAEISKDPKKSFGDDNKKVIFDLSDKNLSKKENIKEVYKYISFSGRKVRVKNGLAYSAFSTKTREGNFYFKAYAILEETKNKKSDLKLLESNDLQIKVRAENLYLTNYLIYKNKSLIAGDTGIDTVEASEYTNLFISNSKKLLDSKQSVLEDNIKKQIFESSTSKEKLVFDLVNFGLEAKMVNLDEPLHIIIEDNLEKDEEKRIIFDKKINVNTFSPLLAIKKAGDYTIKIVDADGLKTEKNFFIKPALAQKAELKLSSSVMQTGGNIISGFIYLYDKYNNLASDELYDINLNISGEGIEFLNLKKQQKLNTFEGAKLFKIKSTKYEDNNEIIAKIISKNKNINLETKTNVQTLKDIKLKVNLETEKPVVGNKKYYFDINVVDKSGKILTGFNSEAYVTVNNIYFSVQKDYIKIKNGKARGYFKTKTVAVKDKAASISIKVEGIKDYFNKSMTVYPEKPVYIDYHLQRDKLVALDYLGQRPTDLNQTDLYVELKDRYNNLVFEDKSKPNKYTFFLKAHDVLEKRVHKFDQQVKPENNPSSEFRDLKGVFGMKAVTQPGLGYFKIFVTPSLENNTFELVNKDTGEKEVVHGLSETTGKLTTYYFYNKSNIRGAKYNALYTTLLGADYGNIFIKDYLAGAMLFDKNNRSLAVTSLIDSPYKKNYVLNISRDGNINFVNSSSDLSKNIKVVPTFEDYGFSLALYNESINSFIGQIYYNLDKNNLNLQVCKGDSLDFITCKPEKKDKTTIFLKSSKTKYEVKKDGEDLVLYDKINSKNILKITKDGKLEKSIGIDLVLSRLKTEKGISFIIKSSGVSVGVLSYIFDKAQTVNTKSPNFFKLGKIPKFKLGAQNNFIGVFINSGYYQAINNNLAKEGISITYLDPFENRYDLNSFAKQTNDPYENFVKSPGVGWRGQNKILLNFAAGKNVGEAVKDYESFFTINLGDPVIYLKKIKKNLPGTFKKRKFDATIGKLITSGDDILTFSVFDYNNDKIQDIVVLKNDGAIYLYEGTKARQRFIDKGRIVKFGDIGTKAMLIAGDFFGDGYGDLALTDAKGKIIFINNYKKDFYRIKKDLFNTNLKVSQLLKFDMDNDGKMDIISFDLSGELNIFYAKGDSKNPSFTKNTLSKGLGLTLNSNSRTGIGALYFDGLEQLKTGSELNEEKKKKRERMLQKLKTREVIEEFKKGNNQKASAFIMQYVNNKDNNREVNEEYFDNLIYEKIAYNPNINDNPQELSNKEKIDQTVNSIETNSEANLDPNNQSLDESDKQEFAQYKKDLSNSKQSWANIYEYSETKNPGLNDYTTPAKSSEVITTFIKSKYSKVKGVEISKVFTDVNGGILAPGDIVKAKVIIKNNSANPLQKVAYIEKVPELLLLKKDSIKVNGQNIKAKNISNPKYNFLIDSYNIGIGEQLVLEYETKVLDYKIGSIKVGLFEKGEDGDDEYGDVIFKNAKYNCGDPYIIYRSIAARKYEEGEKAPVCKAKLPDALEGNNIDADGNNIPDKYDELINSAIDDVDNPDNKNSKFKDFAKEGLEMLKKDTDGDGIPDLEDNSIDSKDDDTGFLNNLDKFEENAKKAVDNLEFMIQGFGCGFGGGSCISSPLNWAPLAPGSDPTAFGYPIGDGLHTFEGFPIFSLFTLGGPLTIKPKGVFGPGSVGGAARVIHFTGPFEGGERSFTDTAIVPVPPIGPINPVGAGGRFGYAPGPIRIFVTPTITGAIGTAICFGDNLAAGYLPPPGLSPIVSGGNCVVIATPLFGCKSDGSDGDVSESGEADINNGEYGVWDSSCIPRNDSSEDEKDLTIKNVQDYLNYKIYGNLSEDFKEFIRVYSHNLKEGVQHIAGPGQPMRLPKEPLFKLGNKSSAVGEIKVDIDLSEISKGNFKDIVKMQMKRIPSFPEFLMQWVHEQIDEIITKLTDFPTITIILPDFSGLLDFDWDNFGTNFLESFELGKQKELDRIKAIEENKIQPLLKRKKELGCPENVSALKYLKDYSEKKNLKCLVLETEINKLKREQYLGTAKQINSGIQSVYKFLGSVPIVNIYSQKIHFNIPWIDLASLDKVLFEMQTARIQREREIKNAIANWSMGAFCDKLYPTEAQAREKCKTDSRNKAIRLRIDSQKLLASLDRNIQILKEYKKLPEKLQLLIRIKEKRLQQILCNIETWTRILPSWLKLNGKRFKSWVELYVLIKAVLKSWQALPDVFLDYEAECKQCKNERQDLMGHIFQLIDMLIPKLPIIKFPKWPDLIIDLHNIRAGISVALPDFDFRFVPINVPKFPQLFLPTRPYLNATIKLPEIPLLTDLKLPDLSFIKDLPDLPSLPDLQLPNLPPAPKLPKLFSSIDKFIDILKLITKAMCLLKQNPFIPEWRAGDQISFITERGGYLKTDFWNVELPQYKMTAIDAFAITSYINLEFESDFLVDIVKEIVSPLQDRLNDVINHMNIRSPKDWDFRKYTPADINVEIDLDKKINFNLENNLKNSIKKSGTNIFSMMLDVQEYMLKNRKEINNDNFRKLFVQNSSTLGDNNTKRLREIGYSLNNKIAEAHKKVDKINEEILENNKQKFQTLKNIISTEIKKNRELEKQLKSWDNLQKLANSNNINFLAKDKNSSKIKAYNQKLAKFNKKTFIAYKNLYSKDKNKEEFEKIGKNIISRVDSGLKEFSQKLAKDKKQRLLAYSKNRNPRILLAGDPNTNIAQKIQARKQNTLKGCKSPYVYKGIYIREEGRQYRLFDYLDEITGDETTQEIDFDNDGDKDLLYLMGRQLYLKENLSKKESKIFFNEDPIIYDKIDEFEKNIIESINDLRESVGDNGAVNIQFMAPTNTNTTNFRFEFYSIVDKFDGLRAGIIGYTPKKIRKHIIDSFVNIDDITSINPYNNYNNFKSWFYSNKYDYTKNIIYEKNGFKHYGYLNKDLAYIENIGNSSLVKIKTYQFIEAKVGSKISAGTRIYAKNATKLKYLIYREGKDEPETGVVDIPAHSGVTFSDDIEIAGTSRILYIKSKNIVEVSGVKAEKLIGLPILPGTRMEFDSKTGIYSAKDYLQVRYYNDYVLKMHFSKIKFYEINDLGTIKDSYLIRLNIKNDFYYSKISAFDNKKQGTSSKQLLISPQEYNDNYAPEIDLKGNILVPVYSLQKTDISSYIYEDSGLNNIKSIKLDEGSSGNGKIKVIQENGKIFLELGKFDEIIKKKIKLILEDKNGNIGDGVVNILIYPPVAQIEKIYKNLDKISGVINEELKDEPVSIFRYRAGVLTRLNNTSGDYRAFTKQDGSFEFLVNGIKNEENPKIGIFTTNPQTQTKQKIAEVDKNTGKITKLDNNSYIRVLAANDKNNDKGYIKIILSNAGKDLYYNYIVAPNSGKVILLKDLKNVFGQGIFVKILDTANYGILETPITNKINPGAVVIHKIGDTNIKYFNIFRDGRIEVFNGAKIRYVENSKYLEFNLDIGPKTIAKVIIKTKNNFILR